MQVKIMQINWCHSCIRIQRDFRPREFKLNFMEYLYILNNYNMLLYPCTLCGDND